MAISSKIRECGSSNLVNKLLPSRNSLRLRTYFLKLSFLLFSILSYSVNTTAESNQHFDYRSHNQIYNEINRNGNVETNRLYEHSSPDNRHPEYRYNTQCYDNTGKAQRCFPHFENAAYRRPIEATNTCGSKGPTLYCIQTGEINPEKTCYYCHSNDHPPSNVNDNNTQTFWQSETMAEGIQHPNEVNITLDLGKSFEITYVRLRFHSPRPHSLAIYKKVIKEGVKDDVKKEDWIPFQYYSSACFEQFGVHESSEIPPDDETRALCTSEFTEISPLSGGSVIFASLEGRPSANYFDRSHLLQQFVTATQIRIVLKRLNTFGDEHFADELVLRSYYYAISDIAVGGRCKCNGHANRCIAHNGRLKCDCKHNTAGIDCQKCDDFYNDQEWSIATPDDAHECKPCNCNGKATRCFFDKLLWEQTGHGGHCLDCKDNTDGPNCERCKPNHYKNANGVCVACRCNEIGSEDLQCNALGMCPCKAGVTGQYCDRCAANHYGFSVSGCKSCDCNDAGCVENVAECDDVFGKCRCKKNVEGQKCDSCKPGYFDLQAENEFGCLRCYCFGHATVCKSAENSVKYSIETTFTRDSEKWTAKDKSGREAKVLFNPTTGSLGVRAERDETIYFVAPERYLGDQRSSYNQFLIFTLRLGDDNVRSTFEDVIIRGKNFSISQPIFGQGNQLPKQQPQVYKFRLHDDVSYGWTPRLSSNEFMGILANIQSIEIRGNYYPRGFGYLNEVKLESAQLNDIGQKATWVEYCTCPPGYVGQFCESCDSGWRRLIPNGGSTVPCVRCNCNNHTDICDPDSGKCICDHNTRGDNCEMCAEGFYGNALQGTPNDCTPCPCPDGGACVVLSDQNIACLQCPEGYSGFRCDLCIDGYYGDPEGKFGSPQPCRKCECNDNVDENAVGNCDPVTGECLKCIYNTHGRNCDQCLPGFYGNPLAIPKGNCRSCGCHSRGTKSTEMKISSRHNGVSFLCNQEGGQCDCKSNVMGRQCDQCVEGYWNIESGNGCEPCNCSPLGSESRSCDELTGRCKCKPGVTGDKCDRCLPEYFGFSEKGCHPCNCDRIGSVSLQCDDNGRCPCHRNIDGLRCERCRENMYNMAAGCIDCPACYNLVQDAVTVHRSKLGELTYLLDEIEKTPAVIQDTSFSNQLEEVMRKVDHLLREAKKAQGAEGSLTTQMEELKMRIIKVYETGAQVKNRFEPINSTINYGKNNVTLAFKIIDETEKVLAKARKRLSDEGVHALNKAKDRAKRYGQQTEKISGLAKLARNLADSHEEDAQQIQETINDSLNSSRHAYQVAKAAVDTQEDNRMRIEELRGKLEETNEKLQKTKTTAIEAKRVAKNALAKAVEIFSDLESFNKSLPKVESERIKQEAMDAIAKAKRISDEADSLSVRHGDILNKTKTELVGAKELLDEASRQQQITDDLLTEIDATLNEAEAAVRDGESTVKEANKTLTTLKEFDKLVKGNQEKAKEAMKNVGNITKLISEAEEKTNGAKDALQGALQDATEALQVAENAKDIAEKASEDTNRIKEDASKAKEKASTLKADSKTLSEDVIATSEKMKDYEAQAEHDDKLAKDVLQMASQAKTTTVEAKTKVTNASKTLDDIIYALDNLDNIEDTSVELLEKRLSAVEKQLNELKLDERTALLQKEKDVRIQRLRNYDEEITKLKVDVGNIKEIRESMPNTCFKSNRLEP